MLTLVTIGLIIAAFVTFVSALRLLSGEELQSFNWQRPFSGWYFVALCLICVGLLVVEDDWIASGLAAVALACTVYEHLRNSASLGRMQVSERFKRRLILAVWLADAVVIAIVIDSLLSHLEDV